VPGLLVDILIKRLATDFVGAINLIIRHISDGIIRNTRVLKETILCRLFYNLFIVVRLEVHMDRAGTKRKNED
jgi:hypothetical protein